MWLVVLNCGGHSPLQARENLNQPQAPRGQSEQKNLCTPECTTHKKSCPNGQRPVVAWDMMTNSLEGPVSAMAVGLEQFSASHGVSC